LKQGLLSANPAFLYSPKNHLLTISANFAVNTISRATALGFYSNFALIGIGRFIGFK